jgi:hypothetical protein
MTLEQIGLLRKEISPTGPLGTALPLLGTILFSFFISLVQWISDKLEDYKENNLSSSLIELDDYSRSLKKRLVTQKALTPGQVVHYTNGERIGADIIILPSHDEVTTFRATDLTGM